MEAGLPITNKGEERMMSKEPLLPDGTTQPRTCRHKSTIRRVLIALAVFSLLGLGLVVLGGVNHVCSGRLRTEIGHKLDAVVPEMIHEAFDSDRRRRGRLARRRLALRQQTPVPTTTANNPGTTQGSQPTTNNAGPTTQAAPTQAPSSAPASNTQQASRSTSNNAQPTSNSRTTAAGTSSSAEAPPRTSSSSAPSAPASSSSSSSTSPSPDTSSSSSSAATTGPSESTSSEEPESTLTTGTQRTSSAVQRVFTSTLQDGGVTTLTSTSWLAVVPTADSNSSGGKPGLQNSGSQYSVAFVLQAALGMIAGGLLLL